MDTTRSAEAAMRITENGLATSVLGNITGSLGRLAKVQEKLATTKTINRPSDDPLGATLVLRYQAAKEGLAAYQRTVDATQENLRATGTALERIVDVLQDARDTGVRGSDDLQSTNRGILARQIDQHLEELLAESQVRFADRYLFGGTQATSPPFTGTRDAAGRIIAVTANARGIGGSVSANVAEGVALQANIPGDQAFTQGVNLFDALIQLRDALTANDTAGVAAATARVGQGIDQVNAAAGVVGVRVQRLERVRTQNTEDLTRTEQLRSRVQDADIAALYVEVEKMENAFQAALAAGSKAMQASLLDYLR